MSMIQDIHSIAESLKQIARTLARVFPGPAVKFTISIGGKVGTTAFQLQDVQKVPYSVVAVDADGNPAALATGATIAVASSDPTIATVVPDASPAAGTIASGFVVGQSKLGTVQISVAVTNADGTPGPTGTAPVQVVAGAAATIQVNLGAAVSQ